MKKVRYAWVDVFSNRPFGGNALAVFPDARNLSSKEMQSLARETNLSETTFVLPPSRGSGADFRVRIFVPDMEVRYAGHPTLGTFFVLAKEGRIKLREPVTTVNMEVKAGVMPVEIHSKAGKIVKVVTVQNKPVFGKIFEDVRPFTEALSLDQRDVEENLPVQLVSTGLPWVIVPARSRKVVERAIGNVSAFREAVKLLPKDVVDIYVTCLNPLSKSSTTHSRGFSLVSGNVVEDPATGSASGCLGAYLVSNGLVPATPLTRIINEQGYEMGRPSKIEIEVRASAPERIEEVRVGGKVTHMMDGVAYI